MILLKTVILRKFNLKAMGVQQSLLATFGERNISIQSDSRVAETN